MMVQGARERNKKLMAGIKWLQAVEMDHYGYLM